MAKILIQELYKNPQALVRIGSGTDFGRNGLIRVKALITDEITLTGSAEFNTPLYSGAQEQFSQAYQRVVAGTGAVSAKAQGYLPNVSPIALQQTVASWTGTSKPVFSLKLVFVALKETDDIKTEILKLYQTVFPSSTQGGSGTFLKAPLGFTTQGIQASGTLTIEVGTWFRASGQIMKDVSFTFSKQTMKSGNPLYASGSITFEPFRAVTFSDIKGYLTRG